MKLIIANWKMNGTKASALALAQGLTAYRGPHTVVLCPPACHLESVGGAVQGSALCLGAQDCADAAAGPYTGDISASMLADLGCGYVIVGHSERRHGHIESDAEINKKLIQARHCGLTPILCVGELMEARANVKGVLERQLLDSLAGVEDGAVVIAYEPVWAIGSGLTPTVIEIESIHALIRAWCVTHRPKLHIQILYGGSVKSSNAQEILSASGVDGVLVGGASLDAAEFLRITAA